jgi:hypothetical protein
LPPLGASQVARECCEEVGLHLMAPGRYRSLGRTADHVVRRPERGGSVLLVRCYVFEQLRPERPRVDAVEVAACGWAPLSSLLSDELVEPLPAHAGGGPGSSWVGFPSVPLPIPASAMWVADPAAATWPWGQPPVDKAAALAADAARPMFSLWGLTLSMVNDMLLASGLRAHAISFAPFDRRRL